MLSSDRYNRSGLTCLRMVAASGANTHTASPSSIARTTASCMAFFFFGVGGVAVRKNIGVCNLAEGILGGWRDGEEGGQGRSLQLQGLPTRCHLLGGATESGDENPVLLTCM